MQLETCYYYCCAAEGSECTFGVPSDGPSEAFRAAHKISNRSKVHPFGLPFSGACLCQGDKLAKLQTRPLSKYRRKSVSKLGIFLNSLLFLILNRHYSLL